MPYSPLGAGGAYSMIMPLMEQPWTREDALALADDDNRYNCRRGALVRQLPFPDGRGNLGDPHRRSLPTDPAERPWAW
jgi:hypothetical protein